jgi:putative MATE family efflux protein
MTDPRNSRLDAFIQRPRRAVWVMALPMMGGMMFHSLYNVADTAFVGQLGPEALAALTFVFPLFFVIVALASGLGTGVTAGVAQAIGRRDHEDAGRVAANGLTLGIIGAVSMAVVGQAFGPRMLELLGASGDTVRLAWDYLQIVILGLPLFFVSGALRAVLNGEGDAKTPMMVMAGATALNLILDPIFIFTLDMGIRGAAVATIIAQGLTLLTFIYLLLVRRRSVVRIHLAQMPLAPTTVRFILVIALPMSLSQLLMAGGAALTNRLLAHFGQLTVAGYGAAFRVNMLVGMPIMGLAVGSISVIGMFAGAQRVDLVRSTTLYTFRWAVTIAFCLGVSAWLASHTLMHLFTDDPTAISVGETYLGFMVFAYPMMGIGMTSGRILQGLGYGVPALIISAVRMMLVGVPAAYVAVYAFDAPLEAVWASFIFGGFCSVVLAVLWVRSAVWMRDPSERAARRFGGRR